MAGSKQWRGFAVMFMAIIGVSLALFYRPTAQAQAAAPQEGSQAPYFAAADVEKAFEKNAVIYEEKESFRVSASRREKPGEAEVHAEMTDIFYVLDGTATFVTGGKVVEPRTASAGEIRGASIQGGETRTLGKGDVIVIPAGTPHWFKGVKGTFRNLVVKVRKK